MNSAALGRAQSIAARVQIFVRGVVIPYEKDARCGAQGPADYSRRSRARRWRNADDTARLGALAT